MESKPQDIRWVQRLANYSSAIEQLTAAVQTSQVRELSSLEKQGLIQAFEFTHELAWKVMRDYLVYQGYTAISGSRDAQRGAFGAGLISEGERWMEMITSRNRSSHTYNQAVADDIAARITGHYHSLFLVFLKNMQRLSSELEA